MSTAKWQNIAGSKKVFKSECIIQKVCNKNQTLTIFVFMKKKIWDFASLKEFVGHMYSQQILSQVWYGRLENWQEKSLPSKAFHILVLLIMVPVNVIKKMFSKPVSSSPHVFTKKTNSKLFYDREQIHLQ